jgi:formamidopyrimidine-DNA glycosylase
MKFRVCPFLHRQVFPAPEVEENAFNLQRAAARKRRADVVVDDIFRPHGIEHLTRAGQALVGIDADRAAIEPVTQSNCADLVPWARAWSRNAPYAIAAWPRNIRRFIGRSVSRPPDGPMLRNYGASCKVVGMPELPDITAYISALEPRIVGRPLEHVRIGSAFLLRTARPPVAGVEGRVVRELRRIGKRIAIGVDGDFWLVLHLMIAGRLHWRPPGAKLAGRNNLAAFDFPHGSLVLTEAGTKRRASLHLFEGEEGLRSIDPGGIDVLASDLEAFRDALTAENRTLKRALTDPRILSGIGNAYSDEILHAAQLSPVALTHKLKPEEWERLYAATRSTLELWIKRLGDEAKIAFPEKVTAFRKDMAVHGRYGQPCPRCGEPIQRIRFADNETNYCVRCQTGGKLLADRSLSRLLRSDWPRTLDELETLKRR